MEYNGGDSCLFDFKPNGILFGSKSKRKLSPRSYSIPFDRKCKSIFLIPTGVPPKIIKIFLIRHKKEHAVDGNKRTADGNPTFSHSLSVDQTPWIIIDLAEEVIISEVVITVRNIVEAFRAYAGVEVKIT